MGCADVRVCRDHHVYVGRFLLRPDIDSSTPSSAVTSKTVRQKVPLAGGVYKRYGGWNGKLFAPQVRGERCTFRAALRTSCLSGAEVDAGRVIIGVVISVILMRNEHEGASTFAL